MTDVGKYTVRPMDPSLVMNMEPGKSNVWFTYSFHFGLIFSFQL